MQMPPIVTERAFERLAEIGVSGQGMGLRVAVEGCQSGTIHRVVVCYCPYMSIGPFR